MQLEIITKEDLAKLKKELLLEIKELLNLKPSLNEKEWLKSNEVRALLGISPGTLQTLRINGNLKYSKVGGTYYYKTEEIQKMVSSNSK